MQKIQVRDQTPLHLYTSCGRPKPLPIDLIFYKSDPDMQRQLFPAITSEKSKKVLTANPTVHTHRGAHYCTFGTV